MGNPERMVQNGENALEVTEGSLLDQIVSQTRMNPGDEGYEEGEGDEDHEGYEGLSCPMMRSLRWTSFKFSGR